MHTTKNRFRAKMRSGATQFGLWLGLPNNTAAEICASAGFDWLTIDAEHAPFDPPTVLAHLQALAPYDVAPIVRTVSGEPALLKRYLDIGAETILVPMVDDADTARALVRSVSYPPAGIRGVGTSLARAAKWSRVDDYLARANDEVCLLVQAESATAMGNLDDILTVEGVDGVFIGPSDLAASMGQVGNPGHPDVVAAIETALRKINDAGKYAGILAIGPDLARHYADKGASFIGVGVDTMLLAQATGDLAAAVKKGRPTSDGPTAAGY